MTLDRAEALRYLAIARPDAGSLEAIEPVAAALEAALTPRFTFAAFPVQHTPEGEALLGSGLVLPGEMAKTMLRECSDAVLLLCTLGAGFEARLRAASARDMAQAAMLDACGSAYVEAGCDAAEQAIAARFPGKFLTDRFSPGYGDLPLALQPRLCAALDSQRRLGVTGCARQSKAARRDGDGESFDGADEDGVRRDRPCRHAPARPRARLPVLRAPGDLRI